MILFKDALTGDDIFTDAYKYELKDDLYFHVHGRFIKTSSDVDVDIGANPSEEEQEEEIESTAVTGIDVCLQNRLVEVGLSKSQFKSHIKGFSKKLLERVGQENPERAQFLKDNLPKAVKGFLENFDDYSTFRGEKCDEDGVVVFCKFPDDCALGCNIDVYVWKDALEQEKF